VGSRKWEVGSRKWEVGSGIIKNKVFPYFLVPILQFPLSN